MQYYCIQFVKGEDANSCPRGQGGRRRPPENRGRKREAEEAGEVEVASKVDVEKVETFQGNVGWVASRVTTATSAALTGSLGTLRPLLRCTFMSKRARLLRGGRGGWDVLTTGALLCVLLHHHP